MILTEAFFVFLDSSGLMYLLQLFRPSLEGEGFFRVPLLFNCLPRVVTKPFIIINQSKSQIFLPKTQKRSFIFISHWIYGFELFLVRMQTPYLKYRQTKKGFSCCLLLGDLVQMMILLLNILHHIHTFSMGQWKRYKTTNLLLVPGFGRSFFELICSRSCGPSLQFQTGGIWDCVLIHFEIKYLQLCFESLFYHCFYIVVGFCLVTLDHLY